MSATISIKDLPKMLEKELQKDVKAIKTAAMRAINSSARKSRTAVAKQEAKTLHWKSKAFVKSIKIEKATRENLMATVKFPDNASEVDKKGQTYLMVPVKSGLKKIGIGKSEIEKDMARPMLKYAESHPLKTSKNVSNPHAFFKLTSKKTGQEMIAVRNTDDRSKMNWLFAGRKGKNPDFVGTVKKTMDKHLEKDFERELAKQTK